MQSHQQALARQLQEGPATLTLRWRPLVPTSDCNRLLRLVETIGDALAGVPTGVGDTSLAGGHAGVALFYAFLSAASGRAEDAERARCHRDQAIDGLGDDAFDASLWSGFPGVAWGVELVDRLVDPDVGDRNDAIDAALSEMLPRTALWPVPHDLVAGATGAGLYVLSRRPRAWVPPALELIVDLLEHAAVREQTRHVYWWTPARELGDGDVAEEHPSGVVDLGVAHGVPGAIGLLGLLVAAGVGGERARALLDGAVRWLWSQALAERDGASFPIWTSPDQPERTPARSAWCYGDPGVAAALLVAACGARNPARKRQAVELALRAARRNPAETGVENACMCHGSAGLAHVFHRLYRATGEEELADAARFWLADTVRRCESASASGDPAWVLGGEDESHWTGADIADGAAGIGLVLLAAATEIEPTWDRMFLLS